MNLLNICNEIIDAVEKAIKGMSRNDIEKNIGMKADGDETIGIDIAAENAAIEVLKKYNIHIISEECGHLASEGSKYFAILDPIDGSKNAERGVPCYTTSIAIATENSFDSIQAAVVKNFFTQETFSAEKGKGAFLNNQRLKTSYRTELKDCLAIMCTKYSEPEQAQRMTRLYSNFYDIRRFGTGAYEVCLVAKGNIDIFIKKWHDFRAVDIAAGYLIAKEAGAVITDMDGNPISIYPFDKNDINGFVAVANPELHKKVLNLF